MTASFLLIPPAACLIIGAVILPLLPKALRQAAFLLFPLAALALIWTLPLGDSLSVDFASYTLTLISVDALSRIFGTIFALIALIGGVYSLHVKETGQQSAALLYAGGSLGVVFAGDFLTLFVFWELMAISSTVLIWARRTSESRKAGMRYVLVHLFGGGLLLAGILLHIGSGESLTLAAIAPNASLAAWLILLGVALNAAVPPLHAWLADAYPKATVTGAVFLSAFTTKTAVYVLIRLFPGWEILLFAGVIMAIYGVIYAVMANDIREILAYHIVSQVGYMVAAVGIGTALALNGAVAHAFCHILYKALLFMGAGAVLHTTGTSKLALLGGLARYQKPVMILYMIGAFSIAGFPLFNGFVSKSMIVSAAGYAHYEIATLLLMLVSIGTFLSTGLKLPYLTWFGPNRNHHPPSPTPHGMVAGMAIAAFLCVLLGVAPGLLYAWLPYEATYQPFTVRHVVEVIQMMTFTFVAYWFLRHRLVGDRTLSLDTDWLYRRPAGWARLIFVDAVNFVFDTAERQANRLAHAAGKLGANPARLIYRDVSDEYVPGRYRKPITAILLFVLFCFALIAFVGILA